MTQLREKKFGLARLLAMILLAGIGAESLWLPKPANADAYHKHIRVTAAAIPMRAGDWIGEDIPVPDTAVQMLSPNVIISRRYIHAVTGAQASLLLVQCGDARDIVVHYPPICMCNSGWTLEGFRQHDWMLNGLPVVGTEYRFDMHSLDQNSAITVDNFMMLPNGRIARNMDAVNEAASDIRRRYFGAAQVQIITPAAMPAEERERTFQDLAASIYPTMNAILAGVPR